MEITNNGILMTSDYQGRSSGEAYVQFSSKNDAERALEKNKQSIGHRLVWLGMGPGYLLGPTTYIDPFRGWLENTYSWPGSLIMLMTRTFQFHRLYFKLQFSSFDI